MSLEGWKKEKLTALADFINGYAFKPNDWTQEGIPIIRIEQLKNPNKITDFYKGKLPNHNIIENGDLIFSWSASLFLSIWKHGKAALNQHLFKVIEKTGIDRRFLKYLIEFYIPVFENASHGSTMKHITRKALNNFEVTFPEKQIEQSLIAEILSTVDRAIEQTEAVIAKLQRIKTGLMQDLLTRGIDEQGNIRSEKTHRFKDSPLGRIPVEWEVVKLQDVVKILLSNVDKKIYEHENSVLLCNYLEVYQNDYIHSRLNFSRGSVNENELRKFTVEKGDVIITKDSETFEDIAKPAYVKDDIDNLICGYHLALLKPKRIDGLFLAKILKKPEINMHFMKLANGITRYGLTVETIKSAKIFLPKISEQKQISNIFLNIDLIIDEEMAILKKLHRLKTALMQDLLTGRVRVTGLLHKHKVS